LGQARQSLFTLVREIIGEVCEVVVDQFEGFCVIAWKFDLGPPSVGEVGTLDLFDVEVKTPGRRI